MARWNENEFIKHAQSLAEQHLVTKKSLNELAEKFSSENSLNPEEIRTLVRLANVATFQELFKTKADGDKMIEFETGDPEAVIRRMVSSATEPPQTANINNDKLAGELPDMMADKRRGFKLEDPPAVKVASEDAVKAASPDVVVMNLRKLESEFSLEKISAGMQWEEKLGSLVTTFKRAPGYGPAFKTFEKEAWASFGSDVAPEMAFLYEELRLKNPLPSNEKIAELHERVVVEETPELNTLKQAVDARKVFQKMSGALAWIDKNMPALGR